MTANNGRYGMRKREFDVKSAAARIKYNDANITGASALMFPRIFTMP
jgi:hypothetical protein